MNCVDLSAARTLRKAEAADIPDIMALAAACGLEEWSARDYLREIERPEGIVLVLRRSEALDGFLAARIVPGAADERPDAEIFNIGVAGGSRRQGIATVLLTAFFKLCGKQNVNTIWLEVRASNEPAISFYRRHGFTHAHTRKGFYRNPVEDARVMRLSL